MSLSSSSRSWFRGLAAVSAVVLFAVGGGATALADNVVADGDALTAGAQSSLAFGGVPCGVSTSKNALVSVIRQGSVSGNNTFANSAAVDVSVSSSSAAVLAVVPSGGAGDVNLSSTWTTAGNGTTSESVTVPVTVLSTTPGSGTATLTFTGTGPNTDGSSINRTDAVTVTWTTGSCSTPTATTVSCPTSLTYTGAALTPCTGTVTGSGGFSRTVPVDYTGNIAVGTATASASYAGDATHLASSGNATFLITKAGSSTTVSCPASTTWTGAPLTPCTASVTGAGGLNQSITPTYADNTAVGTSRASATFVGDANHNGSSDSKTFEITKAGSTVTVTCTAGPFTYNGSAQAPCSATVTGTGLDESVPVTYDDNINAGLVTASASFAGDSTHSASSGSATFTIGKADATCTINGYDDTYDAAAHSATGTCTGAKGETLTGLDLGASFTNVPGGTAHWTFTPVSGNYNGDSGTADITIGKADASCTINGYDHAYDAAAHGATGSCTGIGGESAGSLALGASFTDVPGGTANWAFTGNANYTDQAGDVDITIGKALSTVTLVCDGAKVFTGSPVEPCSAAASGVGLEPVQLVVGYTVNVHPGPVTAKASWPGDDNHFGDEASEVFTIAKAPSTTTVTCPTSVYFTGSTITPCSATATGVGGLAQSVTVTYTDNTLVGTATAKATFAGDGDHLGSSGSATFQIAAWSAKGFYQPVDMSGVWNTVKGGSTVPLKFELFAGTTELTSTSSVDGFTIKGVACPAAGLVTDDIELVTTGGTSLRYDSTGGQFIQNWQTPKKAGACYTVTMTAMDGSLISANFKLK